MGKRATTMDLTSEQLRTLRHMLGIDNPYMKEPKPSRDYACANPGDPQLRALADAGAVRQYATRGGYEWFCCTDAGRAAALASHRTIRVSKAKRVYARFLDVRDCVPDLTFHQFLTDPEMAQFRQAA